MQSVFNKKIKVYLIVPKDVSNNEAYFTQTKKAKIIWKILVVINTDVIKRQIWNFKIVYEGTFMKK
jgi:type IV secretory pathway ATPase VirB11/archaellum biosynthesis ATPase